MENRKKKDYFPLVFYMLISGKILCAEGKKGETDEPNYSDWKNIH